MGNYICTGCDYRFSSEDHSECPHCGRETLEKEKDASELIDEVKSLLES